MKAASRDVILSRAAKNKPAETQLPNVAVFQDAEPASLQKFADVFKSLGGKLYHIKSYAEMMDIVKEQYSPQERIVSPVKEITAISGSSPDDVFSSGHLLQNVELAVIKAHFAVAENAAVWVTENITGNRVLPFICQHLAVVINEDDIVATMHDAYLHPAFADYNYGVFISGPSKTADIEQSLVLGAHGPKSMAVFIMQK